MARAKLTYHPPDGPLDAMSNNTENQLMPTPEVSRPPITVASHNIAIGDDVVPFMRQEGASHVAYTKAIGYICMCNDGWFCRAVNEYLYNLSDVSWEREIRLNDTIQILLPVFGSILHRIDVGKTLVSDWEGKSTSQLIVHPRVYPGIDDASYHPYFKGTENKHSFLWHLMGEIERTFRSNADARALVESGIDNVIRCSSQSCKAKRHSGFGAQKQMSDFLLGPLQQVVRTDRLWSAVFTSLNYDLCFPCAKSSDTAFWSSSLM